MGASLQNVETILEFEKSGIISSNGLIVEIGAQEFLHNFDKLQVRDVFSKYRSKNITLEEIDEICLDTYTSNLYEALGFSYQSFDIFLGRSTRKLDLNFDSAPLDFAGKADVVTNFGTTEHILNQLNCFKVIHDLTRVGGLMWHDLPASDYIGHGFFKYDPGFFLKLASINQYRILRWDFTESMSASFHSIPNSFFDLGFPRIESKVSAVHVILQKTKNNPFQIPVDSPAFSIENAVHLLEKYKSDDRIFIYGTGKLGNAVENTLKTNGFNISGFIDSYKAGISDNHQIYKLDDYLEVAHNNDRIIVASMFANEIVQSLADKGLVAFAEVRSF